MIRKKLSEIFKRGSKTYFYSSIFFPNEIREDVTKLYAFVRTADNYVDNIPPKKNTFKNFVRDYNKRNENIKASRNEVINSFVEIRNKHHIPNSWVDSFIESMCSDLTNNKYLTRKEIETYIYGSAEVIGLMMAKILDLPKKSFPYARKLGRAMQYANFIRDINEDNKLKRVYIPSERLKKYKISNLSKETAYKNSNGFKKLIRKEIDNYRKILKESEPGLKYIPKRYRIAVKTSSDMYKWTMNQIYKDPFLIYKRKVKPSALHIMLSGITNLLFY